MIVDSHCHLNHFSQQEREQVIANARASGVGVMQTICTTIGEFDDLLEIARFDNQIYTSVGVHPSNAAEGEYISAEDLIKLTTDEKVIGIGETGLDFYKQSNKPKLAYERQVIGVYGTENRSSIDIHEDLSTGTTKQLSAEVEFQKRSNAQNQIKSFLSHIEAARITGLPLIIHSRDADDEMINILESEIKKGSFTGVMHCFSSSDKLAQKAIELGLYISFSGIITFKNAKAVKDIAAGIPPERTLVETDSPFLSPEPHRGKKNEPAMTKYVVDCLAKLWNKSSQEVEVITTNNFFKLFAKASI